MHGVQKRSGDWDICPIVSHNNRVKGIFREKILNISGVENILLFIPQALLIVSYFLVITLEKSYVSISGKGKQ